MRHLATPSVGGLSARLPRHREHLEHAVRGVGLAVGCGDEARRSRRCPAGSLRRYVVVDCFGADEVRACRTPSGRHRAAAIFSNAAWSFESERLLELRGRRALLQLEHRHHVVFHAGVLERDLGPARLGAALQLVGVLTGLHGERVGPGCSCTARRHRERRGDDDECRQSGPDPSDARASRVSAHVISLLRMARVVVALMLPLLAPREQLAGTPRRGVHAHPAAGGQSRAPRTRSGTRGAGLRRASRPNEPTCPRPCPRP